MLNIFSIRSYFGLRRDCRITVVEVIKKVNTLYCIQQFQADLMTNLQIGAINTNDHVSTLAIS